jgi:putative tricarboxylic transport membrane protein
MMFLGTAAGILVGAVPGLTATMAVAVLLPLTFGFDPVGGMLFLLGIYAGGIYGGSITAILINTPGTPAAAATLLDGYPLARKGRALDALKMAIYASTIGGIISGLVLLFVAPLIASFALRFGPPEYFALAVFGLSIIATVASKNLVKGLISASLGILIATVGLDAIDGMPRFTFGIDQLTAGIPLIPALIGLFAVGELLHKTQERSLVGGMEAILEESAFRFRHLAKYLKTIVRGGLIGTFIGSIPGTGSVIAAFMSYNEAKRTSSDPDRYGEGELDGVAAAESANNGVTGATLIPLLTLGIPGDTVTAILLGALMIHGLTPGPQLFVVHGHYVYTVMVGFLFVNLIMLFQARFAIHYFSKVTQVPNTYLSPIILIFCVAGTYAVNNSIFDVYLMLIFGVLGYLLPRFGFSVTPLLLALVLGPLAESSLRQALIMSGGNPIILVQRPIAFAVLAFTLLLLLYPFFKSLMTQHR